MGFDFEGMDEKQKSGGFSRKSGAARVANLPLRKKEVHVSNPKKATTETDYFVGEVLAPVLGLEAGSEVRVKIDATRPKPADPDKTPMEVFDIQDGRKKGNGHPVQADAIIVAENAKVLEDGTIECRWIRVAEHEYKEKPAMEKVQVGVAVAVEYMNVNKNDFAESYQYRTVHFPEHAYPVHSGEDGTALETFKKFVLNFLTDRSAEAGGRPGVMLRLVNNAAIGEKESALHSEMIFSRWDKDASAMESPEATLDRWLDPEAAASYLPQDASAEARTNFKNVRARWINWITHADEFAKQGGTIEVWPIWRYSTAKNTAKRDARRKHEGKFHKEQEFTAPRIDLAGNPVYNESGKVSNDYGLVAEGILQVIQYGPDSDWMANDTWTIEAYPSKLFKADEQITENIPQSTKDFFADRAARRVAVKYDLRKEKNADQEQSNDRGKDFGDDDGAPDPAAGLRPR